MKNWQRSRQSLNLKNLDLTRSANITSDQPKTFSKQQNPFLLELGVSVTINEELIDNI
jgi:hypothetical protein